MRIPKVKPRRNYDRETFGNDYKESDSDFVENNIRACVWFLENRDKLKVEITKVQSA